MNLYIEKPNEFGQLSEVKLKTFERKNNIKFPKDYRNFLLKNNGGKPHPSFFWINTGEDGSGVNQFFGLHNGPEHLSISSYFPQNRFGFPLSLLPIGADGIGNYIGLGILSSNFGKVYFIDHDMHPFENRNSFLGIIIIGSFFFRVPIDIN
ncbi:MAG: SMI1/KNR4 family protein [Anaerolineaceae bacterium]